ncbi:MAG: APC family permease [Candidatus Melainabacteria bacterium]|nr:APC family permease [Candidatus Melainabacteria bacterium]
MRTPITEYQAGNSPTEVGALNATSAYSRAKGTGYDSSDIASKGGGNTITQLGWHKKVGVGLDQDSSQKLNFEPNKEDQTGIIGSEMKVGISSFASWMLGVGAIIGSYAWLAHGPMIAKAGPLAATSAWIIAAVLTLPSAFILAELSSMFPSAGGPYVFKYYAFKRLSSRTGEMIGFLTGWLFYICVICGLSCMGIGFSNLVSTCLYGSSAQAPVWLSTVLIVALFGSCTVMNMGPVNKASNINTWATLLKFGMTFAFGALVFFSPHASIDNVFNNVSLTSSSSNFWACLSSVFLLALSGYSGIEITSCAASETKDASKSVPRAIILTLLATTAIYVSMSIAVSAASPYILGPEGGTAMVAGTSTVATVPSLAGHLAGGMWGNLMTACVVASIVGCGVSCLLSLARVGYSMAATGLFPRKFAELHPQTKSPRYALWFQFWGFIVVACGTDVLTKMGLCPNAYVFMGEVFGFVYAFLAILYAFCLVSLRYTDPDMARPFRVGASGNGLAWTMAICSAAVYGFAAFACCNWVQQVTSLVLLLAGVPIYFYYRGRENFSPANIQSPVAE